MNGAAAGVRFEEVVTIPKIIAVSTFLIVLALVALGVSTAEGAPQAGWQSDLSKATRLAQVQNRPLVVVLGQSGCEACAEYDKELRKVVAVQALRRAVRVWVDVADAPEQIRHLAAEGTPTTVVFTPDTGFIVPVFKYTGTLTAAQVKNLCKSFGQQDLASVRLYR